MKRFTLIFLLFLSLVQTSMGQQAQERQRSTTPTAYAEFQDAKVMQSFGRFVTAKANIFLKNASLVFIQDNKILEANLQPVTGVVFGNDRYVKVNDTQLGLLIMQQGYNQLIRVTTIDMDKYAAEHGGGEDLPYLDMNEIGGMFLEIDSDSQRREDDLGFPLQHKYYFNIRGQIIPANESKFKKFVRPEMKKAFKEKMNDKFWSWSDEASLCQLFVFL